MAWAGRACVALLACAALAAMSRAEAAVLIEAVLEGTPLTLELVGEDPRVIATIGGARYLVDTAAAEITRLDPATDPSTSPASGPATATARPTLDGYRLETWYRGPVIAEHGSILHIMKRDGVICAEIAGASDWMTPFVAQAIEAVALLQRVDARITPRTRNVCGSAPFEVYARNGWPLMIGYRDALIFRTSVLRFDHDAPPELRPPGETTGSANATAPDGGNEAADRN